MHRKKGTWGLGEMDKIKSKTDFSASCGTTVAERLIIIPWGTKHCKWIKTERYPQRDGKNCFKICDIAHHTLLVRPQQERSTTVRTVITTSLSKPLVSTVSKHNSDLPFHIAHSCLPLSFCLAQLGAKTSWLPKQNVSYSNILKEGIQIAAAPLD